MQRWLKFAKYLTQFGWVPVVYAPENADYPLLDLTLEAQVSDDIQVIKQPIFEVRKLYKRLTGQTSGKSDSDNLFYQDKSKLGLLKRIALYIRANAFIPDARAAWIKPSIRYLDHWLKDNQVDVIVSTGPPHSCHLIGREVSRRNSIPWVADFRDPWTDIEFFDQLSLSNSSRRKHFKLQEQVMTSASRVLTVSPSWGRLFEKYGARDVAVITNGYDQDDIPKPFVTTREEFVLSSVGTLELDRNPESFWRAIRRLIEDGQNIRVKLVGKVDPEIARIVPEELRGIIDFVGYVTHGEAVRIMSESDVLLLLQNDASAENAMGRIPGKVFEYLATGNRVLGVGDTTSDMARIIESVDGSAIYRHDDVDGIYQYLLGAIEDHGRQRGAPPVMYERRTLTKQLAAVLDQLVSL